MIKKYILFLAISIVFQTVFVEALNCLQCDSASNADCINKVSNIKSTECKDDKETVFLHCLTSIDAQGKVTRSCSTADCPNGQDCKSGTTDDSNKHNICQTCTSSTDAKCAQSNVVTATFNKVCAAADTECVINIKDKNTERRCADDNDTKNCKNDDTCKKCSDGNCNIGIFPTNRLRCFQCKDAKCNNVIANNDEIKPLPCQFYDSKDKCYVFASSETAMVRGCVSDTAENNCQATGTNELCRTCDVSNCNNQNYKTSQTLKCMECTSTAADATCKWGQDVTKANNCHNQILYNQEEKCYVQTKGDVVQRGCFYDRTSDAGDCKSETNCDTCDKSAGDGCNNKDKSNFTCIICRSNENKQCSNEAEKLTGEQCRNAVSYEQRGCFRGTWNGVVIRGCLVDADERVEATCRVNDTMKCEYCLDKNCNIMKSSASSLNTLATLLLLGIVWLVQRF